MDGDFTMLQQQHEKGLTKDSQVDGQENSKQVDDSTKVSSSERFVKDGEIHATGASETEPSQEENASLQAAETEQATYASANNDLKGTKAYNNADVPGLYTLAMTIVDYRGHRIIAQV
jgi:protein TIF31